jgi:hypothetical protein
VGFTFSGLRRSEKSNDARVLAHSNFFGSMTNVNFANIQTPPPLLSFLLREWPPFWLGRLFIGIGAPLEICTDLFWCTGWVGGPGSAILPGFQSSI